MRSLGVLAVGWVFVVACLGPAGCAGGRQPPQDPQAVAVHTWQINGLTLQTGDLICTNTTSGESVFAGLFYRLYGMVIPGPVDHVIIYIGPGGRCVEAGAKLRVIAFDVPGDTWDPSKMAAVRGPLYDVLYGVAYPLAGRSLSGEEQARIRGAVAAYCLRQAEVGKPYNVLFADSMTDNAFYCSQLAYKAYLEQGIDLNTGQGVPNIVGADSIVYPQEVWNSCEHKKPSKAP